MGDSARASAVLRGRTATCAAAFLVSVTSSCGGFGKQTNCVGTQIEATDASAVGITQAQEQLTFRAVFKKDNGEPLAGFKIDFILINEDSSFPDEHLWLVAKTDENGVAIRNAVDRIRWSRTQLEQASSATSYRAEYPSFGIVEADGKVYCRASDEAEFSFTPGP